MRSWSDVSDDPNDPRVMAENWRVIDAAHGPPVADRVEYLCSLARGRVVLDVGAVEHNLPAHEAETWLHGRLVSVAKQCVGIDVLEDACAALRAKGYDVRVHDITGDPLAERFDVIVAGEVIEHVESPGGLLAGCAAMLEPHGRVVVTTPNPLFLNYVLHGLRGRLIENADHVAQFNTTHMMELGRRAGLRLDRWQGVRTQWVPTPRGRFGGALRWALSHGVLSPESDCESLVFEYVRR